MKNFLKNILYSRLNYKFFIKNFTSLNDLKQISYTAKSLRHSKIMNPIEWKKPIKDNTIIFSPHADDEIVGLGGTIIKSIKNKSKLHCIYFSSGGIRSKECKLVSNQMKFLMSELNFKENNFPINKKNLEIIADIINCHKPKFFFIPFLFDDHDDHRRVNQIFMELIKNNLIKNNFEVWAYQIYSFFPMNVYIDITKNIQKKIFYLKKYKSQIREKNFDHLTLATNALNTRFMNTTKKAYSENFFVCPSKDYYDLCKIYFKNPKRCYYNKNYI